MKIQVFPTVQELTVVAGVQWVLLEQYDETIGRDIQVSIPVANVEATCEALRAAAREASAKDAGG